jgi:hypothetical protein
MTWSECPGAFSQFAIFGSTWVKVGSVVQPKFPYCGLSPWHTATARSPRSRRRGM